jgi:hypothetical protein
MTDMFTWSAERFAKEWEWRARVLPTLVGSLYPEIVRDEMTKISAACEQRFKRGPSSLREAGVVPSTITIEGVTHAYGIQRGCDVLISAAYPKAYPQFDEPMGLVSCLACITRWR